MAIPIRLLSMLCMITIFAACGSDKSISERVALGEIGFFLESNPVYETADIDYGEVKFSQKQDADLLTAYEALERNGYVTMELLKERKRFLSKDSTFVYLVKLTDKSIPFVLEKTEKKAKVKIAEYTLDDQGGAHIEQTGKNRAKATVTLSKSETDFADLAEKGSDSNASFIKKTYSLRFHSETGWGVTK